MPQQIISCDKTQCFIVAEHFLEYFSEDHRINNFDRVLLDVSRLYEGAVLMGALAASKYIQPPVEPRVTFDVDVILPEGDFEDFLNDALQPAKRELLEAYFETSNSVNHSLRHRRTRLYVDFTSAVSRPISAKLVRRVLADPDSTTNLLTLEDRSIRILKPEFIIAMKLHRYAKDPRSEKALSDRLDIVKMLKTYHLQPEVLDPEGIRAMLRRREIRYFDEMREDVACEMCGAPDN